MKEKVLKKVFYIAVGLFSLFMLFELLHLLATLERGRQAIGGEACVFFLPAIWYAIINR